MNPPGPEGNPNLYADPADTYLPDSIIRLAAASGLSRARPIGVYPTYLYYDNGYDAERDQFATDTDLHTLVEDGWKTANPGKQFFPDFIRVTTSRPVNIIFDGRYPLGDINTTYRYRFAHVVTSATRLEQSVEIKPLTDHIVNTLRLSMRVSERNGPNLFEPLEVVLSYRFCEPFHAAEINRKYFPIFYHPRDQDFETRCEHEDFAGWPTVLYWEQLTAKDHRAIELFGVSLEHLADNGGLTPEDILLLLDDGRTFAEVLRYRPSL